MTCEDYPCCGHTDGLGCDWVSPNEVVPCDVCIDARVSYPYHNAIGGCPTAFRNAQNSVPANTDCDCGESAEIAYGESFLCFGCYEEVKEYDRQMQEQYDFPY